MSPPDFESWLLDRNRRPLVMGVLNVTPDSFSEGGAFSDEAAAIAHGLSMLADGADLIDIGGESTKPGASPVQFGEQIRRVVPVIRAIRERSENDILFSIDTRRSEVAAAALDTGASIINDVSAARDDSAMLPLAAARSAPIILMHMLGEPATMQINPRYGDVIADVQAFLRARRDAAIHSGVAPHRILFDPGIGFGKAHTHNLTLLRNQSQLVELGQPLVVGVSRKKFIGTITNEPQPKNRTIGTAAAVAWSVAKGAAIVRVHDVRAMRQVVDIVRAITSSDSSLAPA